MDERTSCSTRKRRYIRSISATGNAVEKYNNSALIVCASQALEDYEAVLRLEPDNEIALAAVGKLRKEDDSRSVRY